LAVQSKKELPAMPLKQSGKRDIVAKSDAHNQMAFSDQNFPKGMSANLKSSKQNISSPGTNMKTFRSKMFRRGRLIPLLAPLDNTDCI
jgi:hypothetical protein